MQERMYSNKAPPETAKKHLSFLPRTDQNFSFWSKFRHILRLTSLVSVEDCSTVLIWLHITFLYVLGFLQLDVYHKVLLAFGSLWKRRTMESIFYRYLLPILHFLFVCGINMLLIHLLGTVYAKRGRMLAQFRASILSSTIRSSFSKPSTSSTSTRIITSPLKVWMRECHF